MILFQNFCYIITVKELFLQSEVQNLHVRISVESCNLLAESAIQNAIFQSDHNIMIFLKLFQKFCINTCNIIWMKGLRSQTGTLYGTVAKGTRYLELTEGYITMVSDGRYGT